MREPSISIEALEVLDAIDRRGSFASAADELNRATSAISYTVQRLEEQLDISLFQRQGRRSVLTPAGKLVLEEGRKIITATRLLTTRAREVANGWESRLRIGLESTLNRKLFFQLLDAMLQKHPGLEVDIRECVLNGGWEVLEFDQIDLLVGAPGPVPQQKGIRAIPLTANDMVPVIARHLDPGLTNLSGEQLEEAIADFRRVVSHDTSTSHVVRSAGLIEGKRTCYVQTIDQKIDAIRAGIGIGHLPRHRITGYLKTGELVVLPLQRPSPANFIAWKLTNRGKALQALTQLLRDAHWD